jgi:hypothetical protein
MSISLKIGSANASINGVDKLLDVPAMNYKDRTFVPIRFIAESLGAEITWDKDTSTVIIKTE